MYLDASKRLRSILSTWTDAMTPDAFAQASAGRSWFRPDDLLRLCALIATLQRADHVK